MDRREREILSVQYFLKEIIVKIETLTDSGKLEWDIKSISEPFIYVTMSPGFYGPIEVDYCESTIKINGKIYGAKNVPGIISDIISLADHVKNHTSDSIRQLADVNKVLDKLLYENNTKQSDPS